MSKKEIPNQKSECARQENATGEQQVNLSLDDMLKADGPHRLIIKAHLQPVGYNPATGECARFQPAGFPEVGHVIYDAPTATGAEKVCIIDSAASMANHLEKVMWDDTTCQLHLDLNGLPYVRCVTDSKWKQDGEKIEVLLESQPNQLVLTTLTEPHRLASEYFMKARWEWENDKPKKDSKTGKEILKDEFGIVETKKGKETRTFSPPTNRVKILKTIFKYDPNSLIHGIFFPDFKDIKLSRILYALLEAKGAQRVPYSGVKFDPIGMTGSGQPIFQKDEETAREITATFVIDLDLIRICGKGEEGLSDSEKKLLLGLALWKINKLLEKPWRYRTQCDLKKTTMEIEGMPGSLPEFDIDELIRNCKWKEPTARKVYLPATELFKAKADKEGKASKEPKEGEKEEEGASGDSE